MQKNKNYQDQRSVNIFGKGTDSNYVRVWAQAIPIATTRSCHCSQKAAIENMYMNEHGCVKIKPHLQKQVMGQIWPVVYSFLSPGFSSVQFSHSVVSDSLRPHESQQASPPRPSPVPGVHSDSRPSSR